MNTRIISIILVFLVPITLIAAAIYKIVTDEKVEVELYLLLIAIPGALIAALKELKSLLPPPRLTVDIKNESSNIEHRNLNIPRMDRYTEAFSNLSREEFEALRRKEIEAAKYSVTTIPLRILNRDANHSIDVLDIKIKKLPEDSELKPRPDRIWPVIPRKDWPEFFNDGKNKSIPPTKILDDKIYVTDLCGHELNYNLRLIFMDNYGRKYSEEITVIKSAQKD